MDASSSSSASQPGVPLKRFYKNTSSQVFWLNDEGRAVYVDQIREPPKIMRDVTADEAVEYLREQSELWSQITRHLNLVFWLLHRKRERYDEDEVREVAIPTCMRCLAGWDREKGEFSTYFSRAFFIEYRRMQARKRRDAARETNDRKCHHDDLAKHDAVLDVQWLLSRLSKQDASILVLYFWYGLTYLEIAETIGMSKSTVFWLMKIALNNARAVMGVSV